jgi:hypothetical protein
MIQGVCLYSFQLLYQIQMSRFMVSQNGALSLRYTSNRQKRCFIITYTRIICVCCWSKLAALYEVGCVLRSYFTNYF